MSMGLGIETTDPRVTAAAARYHQLQQQGMPPPQIMMMLQQEGGLVPVQKLAAAYQQLQAAAKRSQIQPPQPGTVAQQIFAADAQLHGQMPPQPMPPQQMQPPMQQPPADPRMTGVANLPNTMGETGYKGGGIVAFAKGEEVEADPRGDTSGFGPFIDPDAGAPPPHIPMRDYYTPSDPNSESEFGQDVRGLVGAYKGAVGRNTAATAARNQLEQQLADLKNQRMSVAGAFGGYFTSMTPTEREQRGAKLSAIDSQIKAVQGKLSALYSGETPAAVTPAAVTPAAVTPAAAPTDEAAAQKAALRSGVAEFLGQTGVQWQPGMRGAPAPGMGGGFRPADTEGLITPENREWLDRQGAAGALPGTSASIRASLRGGLGGIPRVTADTSAAEAELARLRGEKAPGELDDYTNQVRAAAQKLGIGSANEQMAKYLDQRDKDLQNWNKYDRRMALANAGFQMAMAAGQPGQAGSGLAKFFNAAGVGGGAAAQGLAAVNKEQRALAQRMQEDRIKLAQSEELINMGYLKEGLALRNQAVAERKANERYGAELAIGISRDKSHAAEVNATIAERYLSAQLAANSHPYGGLDMWAAQQLSGQINPTTNKPYTTTEILSAIQGPKHAAMLDAAHNKLMTSDDNYKRDYEIAWGPKADLNNPKLTPEQRTKIINARNSLERRKQNYLLSAQTSGGTGGEYLGNLFGPTAE